MGVRVSVLDINKTQLMNSVRTQVHDQVECYLNSKSLVLSSSFQNSVSSHVLKDTVSFTELHGIHNRCKTLAKDLSVSNMHEYIASTATDLRYSVTFVPPPSALTTTSTKRKRDIIESRSDDLQQLVNKTLDKIKDGASQEHKKMAQSILTNALLLRGSSGEEIVESFCVLLRKLQASDESEKVLIAIRMNAGLAISVSALKRALGKCWADGVLTTASSAMGIDESILPLTEQGHASKDCGNSPLLLVTYVT